MASRAGFSIERLQRFGSEAVKRERRKQEIGHAVTISCEYLGVSSGGEIVRKSAPASICFSNGLAEYFLLCAYSYMLHFCPHAL